MTRSRKNETRTSASPFWSARSPTCLPTPSKRFLRRRPDVVVGVATGSCPVGTDDEVGRRDASPTISLARGLTFMFNESLASRTRIKTLTRQTRLWTIIVDTAAVLSTTCPTATDRRQDQAPLRCRIELASYRGGFQASPRPRPPVWLAGYQWHQRTGRARSARCRFQPLRAPPPDRSGNPHVDPSIPSRFLTSSSSPGTDRGQARPHERSIITEATREAFYDPAGDITRNREWSLARSWCGWESLTQVRGAEPSTTARPPRSRARVTTTVAGAANWGWAPLQSTPGSLPTSTLTVTVVADSATSTRPSVEHSGRPVMVKCTVSSRPEDSARCHRTACRSTARASGFNRLGCMAGGSPVEAGLLNVGVEPTAPPLLLGRPFRPGVPPAAPPD